MHIDVSTGELAAILLEKPDEDIVFSTPKEHVCIGQPMAKPWLIDGASFQLSLQFVHEYLAFIEQSFIVARASEVKLEITAAECGVCCVSSCQHINEHIVRTIASLVLLDGDFADMSLNLVELFEVRSDFQMGT